MRAESPGPPGRAAPTERLGGRLASNGIRINVRLTERPTVATVELSGEFDMAAEAQFESEVRAALASDASHLVVDLRALDFMDSTGLKLLIELNARSRKDGFRLWIVNGNDDPIARVLRVTGLDKVLPVVDQPPGPSQLTE